MSGTLAVAKKEWKAAFRSPVALIFLAIFLCTSLFVFYFMEDFFARNVADAKPFFKPMPLLLVFLSAAFTMRSWSEEARTGTLEVLMTLPLNIRDLVLGKFLAGLGLVAVALALTLPVPVSIAWMGKLDWGPVIGGYLGLMLLASSYLAIGMAISSLTSSQLVSLLVTMVVGGILVGLGYLPSLVSLGMTSDEILRALGTGTRFDSMLRGVLDLSDLIYYASLCGLALALNGLVLEARRWGASLTGQGRRRGFKVAAGAFSANLLVLNLGLGLTPGLRADLTQWHEYSVSQATVDLIEGASEPLLVRGYFSDRTHPLLDPLVPQIRDFLRELRAVGGSNLRVEFVDPTQDDQVALEAKRDYGISPVPFHFSDRHADSVVNAYFHLLVRYGDRSEVLDFEDLVAVDFVGNQVRVRLKNLEYDLDRAIQKTVYGFTSLESICKQLPKPAKLDLIVSSSSLPAELAGIPGQIKAVTDDFAKRCGDRLQVRAIDPDDPEAGVTPEDIYERYGVKPMVVGLFDQHPFYLDMILQVGDRREVIPASALKSEAQLQKTLQAALQRRVPGFVKTVGIAAPAPSRPAYPGLPPQGLSFRTIRQSLSELYEVVDVDLKSGRVPGQVDVLLVLAPDHLDDRARFAIDQFLMRGGATVIATSAQKFAPSSGGGLSTRPVSDGLADLLETYGVTVGSGVVLDERNASFPVPVERNVGGGVVLREVKQVDYPPFLEIEGDGLAKQSPITSGLRRVVMQYASAVSCEKPGEKTKGQSASDEEAAAGCQTLLSSSPDAWNQSAFQAAPDFARYPELGYAVPKERQRLPLAVVVQRKFDSAFAGKKAPILDGGRAEPQSKARAGAKQDPGASAEKNEDGIRAGIIEHSPADARLVVLGSASFLSDVMLSLARQTSKAHLADLQFLGNLIDWSVEDENLLQVRAKQRYARTLDKLDQDDMLDIELAQFGFAGLAVIAIGLITFGRRRKTLRISLDSNGDRNEGGPGR